MSLRRFDELILSLSLAGCCPPAVPIRAAASSEVVADHRGH